MNLYFNYWTNSLKSIGDIGESQKAIVIAKIAQFIISAAGIYFGGGIYALSTAYLLSGLVQRMISKKAFLKNDLILYTNNLKKYEIGQIFNIIWYNAKRAGFSTLMTSAMSQSGTIICSAFLGVEITGAYGLALQLISILCSVSQIYFQANIPVLTSAKVVGDEKRVQQLFSASVMMFWLTTILGLVAICFIGLPILKLLNANTIPSVFVILGIALYNVPESNYAIHATFISMGNKLPFVRSLIYTCFIRIVLSILLVLYTNLGVYSIIVASIISNYSYIVWKWPLFAIKEINLNVFQVITLGIKSLFNDIFNIIFKNSLI